MGGFFYANKTILLRPMKQFYSEYLFDGFQIHKNALVVLDEKDVVVQIDTNVSSPLHEKLGGLIMPAFVNTHCHLELSHLKGHIAKHTGLVDFLLQVNTQKGQFSENEILNRLQEGQEEMLRNGIAAVGDIANSRDTLELKIAKQLNYHTFVETFGLSEEKSLTRFTQSLAVFNDFQKHQTCSLVLHAPYSISESLIKLVDDFNRNKISTFHNQECGAENEFIKNGSGDFLRLVEKILPGFTSSPKYVRSLEYMLDKLHYANHIILVHNTVSNKEDIKIAKQSGKEVYWCICPNANLYIENRLPSLSIFLEEDCVLTIGTDSLASNDELNVWSELCTIKLHFPALEWQTLLQWATFNGAKALKMEHQLGSIEIGKKPGLIHLPLFHPEKDLSPNDPILWLSHFSKI